MKSPASSASLYLVRAPFLSSIVIEADFLAQLNGVDESGRRLGDRTVGILCRLG